MVPWFDDFNVRDLQRAGLDSKKTGEPRIASLQTPIIFRKGQDAEPVL